MPIRVFVKRAGQDSGTWTTYPEGTTVADVLTLPPGHSALVNQQIVGGDYVLQDGDMLSTKFAGHSNG